MKIRSIFHRSNSGSTGSGSQAEAAQTGGGISAEIVAAIGIALRLEQEEPHDVESTILTINHVAYSPWSSRIYATMNQPVKK